jgi:hypothetical protein
MEIGGFDVGFDNIAGTHAGDVFGIIKEMWPMARFEDHGADTSKTDADRDSVEFFVYRHFAAYRAINKVGLEDYLQNDFMHVILESRLHNHATIVVGERNEETEELFKRLEQKLGWKRHEYYQAAS